ncbi:hemerythrin domain-containing protein [Pollutimonas sp. M17]|uniref:hemerythrin domain-containing protein n=1 Tax=Pollutimonas sp. M17 TaxID=2962065 RepID=UPI0021F4C6BA|nr:hemerythrin domain-containing protein [Pollutimonas sp. M17]UYO94916.1 hemerythrin domain-containing protein [Pollutimonas sp. M17]
MDTTQATPGTDADWRQRPVGELVDYIVANFHERHREQLPELIRLSRRVEHAHADRPDCPAGLADALENLQQELESHMMKEEQVLFPMLRRGMNGPARAPVSVMRYEHGQHLDSLGLINLMTRNLTLPENACGTWRSLYGALGEFKNDLTRHIHLENDVLFLNASSAAEGAHHG